MVYYLFNEGIRRPERLTERFPEWRQLFRRLTADTSVLDEYEADYLYCGHRERFWAAKNPAPGTVVEDAVRQGDAVLYRIVPTGTPGAVEFTGCGN